ncbi:protein SIEVE ELEMENT OCCLUSION B-like [Corylus avellana]|uniref:protein SIEVE ELEMENT OCCLUSION B-like n=1 Tax=Corylus avellana TaxID=13451 RepID=UPI00286C6A87|nr:protein SIEVE ELEMENT OCCLUSION B-like [Corylus avellana]
MCDDKIMNEICATHVHDDETFDSESLFIIAGNILKRATHIADKVLKGSQSHQENLEEKVPKANFKPPLCTINQLFAEMACKAPCEGIAYKTTKSILTKLSSYSWDAKVVITLAAFSFEYGNFWLLAQSSDQLAKSVGILKQVPEGLKKYKNSIDELNKVIKVTLEVIESIFEFKRLSIYDTKDVPALSSARGHISVDVFWATITIIACTTQICCITSHEEKTQELSPFAEKINSTLNFLKIRIKTCYEQIEQLKTYRQRKKSILTHTEIMEVLKELIFAKDNLQEIFDGSTKKRVSIEVLRNNNVLLFFSSLDISTDDISILKPIDDGIRKKDQYKILWIPIVEKWTNELEKKFEALQSKMSWYIVQSTEPIVGIRFIKEEWKFENQPILVVMNPQGQVEHTNALHMIRAWGMKAFPFTKKFEEQSVVKESNWFGDIVVGIDHPNLQEWIKDEKYIFFYGGKVQQWIQLLTTRQTAIANDAGIKESRIRIESVCVGKGSKGEGNLDILARFWTGIESTFISKTHRKTEIDTMTLEIQKLLSYKNQSGWAVLTKGSNVVLSGQGTTMSKVVQEYEKWKGFVQHKGFELAIKEYHNKLVLNPVAHIYCSIEISNTSGRILENMKCPDCSRIMETYISFKCCHIDGSAKGGVLH